MTADNHGNKMSSDESVFLTGIRPRFCTSSSNIFLLLVSLALCSLFSMVFVLANCRCLATDSHSCLFCFLFFYFCHTVHIRRTKGKKIRISVVPRGAFQQPVNNKCKVHWLKS